MGKYILVPLNPSDQIKEITPRIEEIAEARMTLQHCAAHDSLQNVSGAIFQPRKVRRRPVNGDMCQGLDVSVK
jgi:hypothetical protein